MSTRRLTSICTPMRPWAALLFLLLPSARASAQTPPSTGSAPPVSFAIAGTVVDALTGAPLAQARVALADTKNRTAVIQQITNENGHFEFPNLPAGKFSLQGAKRGYLAAAYEQHEQFSTAIVSGPDFETRKLVLRLTPMAGVTGHIIDEAGDPVRKASVDLFHENHRGGMTRINRIRSSSSDDRGFYDFSLLEPGTYYVSVSAKPWYAVHTPLDSDAPQAQPSNLALDVAYPTAYYGGASEAESATPIRLNGGDHPQIDIHLNPVPALHLVIHSPTEQQLRWPTLQKHVFDALEPVQPEGFFPIAKGVYELNGIAAGRYTIRKEGETAGTFEQASSIELNRDGQDLSGIRADPLVTVKLTTRTTGKEELPKQFGLALVDSRRRTVGARPVDSSGEAKLEGIPPGKYSILPFSPGKPFSVVKTATPAGEVEGHDLNVIAGTDTEATVFVVSGVVNVEGVVHKAGKPLAGVMVALVPDDPQAHLELFRRDQSDFDGTFLVRAVIPGSYTIVAVEDAWGFEWLQPGVLNRYAQHGQKLSIGRLMQGSVYLPEPVEVQPR